jgi:hypothetical protein
MRDIFMIMDSGHTYIAVTIRYWTVERHTVYDNF